MTIRFIVLFQIFASISCLPAEDFLESSDAVNPYLVDTEVITYNGFFYRFLVYRGGFEHVTSVMVIQKLKENEPGQNPPYVLIDSIETGAINYTYSFTLDRVERTADGLLLRFPATHSYLYEDTVIELLLSENMDYEILSGLVDS